MDEGTIRVIENLDWLAFIDRCDRPKTLFYLDPPYLANEGDYGKALFSRDQFEVTAARLAVIRGQFVLSINDMPTTREIFSAFSLDRIDLKYSIAGEVGRPAKAFFVTPLQE